MQKKNEGQVTRGFPRIPHQWYQRLEDPWTFYENVKKLVWDVRWLLGYIEALEHDAQLAPDALSKRIQDNLSDLADEMCRICNTEIGDYTPKDAADRKNDLKNLEFSPQHEKRTPALSDDEEPIAEEPIANDHKRHEIMLKVVLNSRKSRQKRRKKAGV